MNTNTLHLGDCLEVMATLPDASIDCVLTDPPYGTTACKWDSVIPFDPMWKELKRIAKPKAAICLFGSQPFTSALVMSNPKMFRYEWVWNKKFHSNPFLSKIQPLRVTEYILVFSTGGESYTPEMRPRPQEWMRKQPSMASVHGEVFSKSGKRHANGADRPTMHPLNLLDYPRNHPNSPDTVHPTQKPVELLRYLIRTYTLENETVLDFTMGSGSTGVACELENRKFIGIEKDPDYFAIAEKRIAEVRAREPLFMEAAA